MTEGQTKVLKTTIQTNSRTVAVVSIGRTLDYVTLTDIAKYRNISFSADVVKNSMCSKSMVEFLTLWEKIHNPHFKRLELDQFRSQLGDDSVKLP